MAQVLDLRGRQIARDRTPVLLDPSGGRARVLAWVGRAVAFVFLLWLIGLVFAGLGLLPSGDIPLGRALVGQSPPALKVIPRVTQSGFAGPSSTRQGHTSNTPGVAVGGATRSTRAAAGATASGSTGLTPAGRNHQKTGLGSPAIPGHGHAPVTGTVGAGSGVSSGTGTSTVPASQSNNGVHAGGSGLGWTISQSSPGHAKSSGTGPAAGSGSSHTSSGNGQQTSTTTTPTSASPGKSRSAPGHAAVR